MRLRESTQFNSRLKPEQEINASLNTTGDPYNNQWTAGFTYDNNGNVLTATDAKNITITNNGYDPLNRPASRSYSDGITPTVNFYYGRKNRGRACNIAIFCFHCSSRTDARCEEFAET